MVGENALRVDWTAMYVYCLRTKYPHARILDLVRFEYVMRRVGVGGVHDGVCIAFDHC